MPRDNQKKIIGLLGIGFDTDDGHIRITKGENHNILMGSDESHDYLQRLIAKIESELKERNLTLDDLSPDEFKHFVESIT